MNFQETLTLLVAFELGFAFQFFKILGARIHREDPALRRGIRWGFISAMFAGLPLFVLYLLSPSMGYLSAVVGSIPFPIIIFTTVFGLYLGFSYQTKLALITSKFFVVTSFLVCAYLFLTYNVIWFRFEYTIGVSSAVVLFLLPLYLKRTLSVNREVFYYISVLGLLAIFTWSQFSVDVLGPLDLETPRLVLMFNTLVCGTLYAYLVVHAPFLMQAFELGIHVFWHQKVLEPLFGEMDIPKATEERYEHLKRVFSRKFLNEEGHSGRLLLQTTLLAVLLIFNFLYSFLDPQLLATLIFFALPLFSAYGL